MVSIPTRWRAWNLYIAEQIPKYVSHRDLLFFKIDFRGFQPLQERKRVAATNLSDMKRILKEEKVSLDWLQNGCNPTNSEELFWIHDRRTWSWFLLVCILFISPNGTPSLSFIPTIRSLLPIRNKFPYMNSLLVVYDDDEQDRKVLEHEQEKEQQQQSAIDFYSLDFRMNLFESLWPQICEVFVDYLRSPVNLFKRKNSGPLPPHCHIPKNPLHINSRTQCFLKVVVQKENLPFLSTKNIQVLGKTPFSWSLESFVSMKREFTKRYFTIEQIKKFHSLGKNHLSRLKKNEKLWALVFIVEQDLKWWASYLQLSYGWNWTEKNWALEIETITLSSV